MPAPVDVSARPAGSVSDVGRYLLDLTAPRSHVLTIEPGRGNLILGPARMGKKADLHVAADQPIHWRAFEPFATPAGSAWPRYIDYHGDDSGFFAWSRQRGIEQFSWAPAFADARAVDGGGADIRSLQIRLDGVSGHLHLTLPERGSLGLYGDLSRFTAAGPAPGTLSLLPALSRRRSDAPYVLPELGLLHGARSLSLHAGPLGQPISLAGIGRFAALRSLSLWGGFSDWAALAELPNLDNLEIRFAPDLGGLPALASWPKLDRFIAYNVDEAAGKSLKAQLKARAQLREWSDYTSVSQLRKPEWWQREYGRPFAGWSGRSAKAANAAYDAALQALQQARDADAAKAAIVAFAAHFNSAKGIETGEREDIGEAVWQFSQLAHVAALGVSEEQAQRWFDEVRDY
ncbi:hypothetical protein SAMN04487939_101783 [Lysobacter sp. yr284]|uniref:hypothetical protein n=1 Tax=Lysobacter sp. yr284 TaxID=1761791 RepID=UPI0008949271|nr:hypothetical protein [Lysobacter sp. yr284]SDY31527.1 hypothetical protein SAMN04487939_101783 [Lysobacter sp. yr284]